MVTPSSQTETTGPLAGQLVFTDNNEIVYLQVDAGEIVKIGQAITINDEGFAIAADANSNQSDGIGIACINPNSPISTATGTIDNSAGLDGDKVVQVAIGNTYCFSLATGIIKPMQAVEVDTNGYFKAHTYPADISVTPVSGDVNAAKNFFAKFAGRYWGHPKEEKVQTATVSSDIIAVRLGV